MRAAVARAAADCAVDDERAAAARAVGGGAADGAGRSALISGVQGSVRGNVQGTHDRTRLAMLLLLYYNILCSKSGVTYAKGLTGPNSCRVHNQTPQSSIKLLIYDQIDQMLSDWAQPPIRPRNVRVQLKNKPHPPQLELRSFVFILRLAPLQRDVIEGGWRCARSD